MVEVNSDNEVQENVFEYKMLKRDKTQMLFHPIRRKNSKEVNSMDLFQHSNDSLDRTNSILEKFQIEKDIFLTCHKAKLINNNSINYA
jgi:hypothetical protein